MANVTFYGGPCKGESRQYPDAQTADGKVTCKGTVYDLFERSQDIYFGVPATTIAATLTPVVPLPKLSAASHAWKDLVRGATRTAPRYLQESARYRRAMLRIGRR